MATGNDLMELLSRGHGNESPQHARLRQAVERFFSQWGFTHVFGGFSSAKWPDVLRSTPDGGCVLCIDAKVAKNETSGRLETVERVSGYVSACLACLHYPGVHAVIIGIVTDNALAAGDWSRPLNWHAFLHGGYLPNFQIARLDSETWLVYWMTKP